MDTTFRVLLTLHFLGLGMAFAASFANLVMRGIMARSTPPDQLVLARFAPAMMRFSDTGLVLLWATGLTMLFTRWGGFGGLPWQFHLKITAVVALTGVVGFIHAQMKRARNGNASAAARIPIAARLGLLFAVVAVVCAVWTFN